MLAGRFIAISAAFLAICRPAIAQNVPLAEAPLAKAAFRIELKMDLTGEIRVQQDGKTKTLKQSATAQHVFLERVLDAKNDAAEKTARLYEKAEVTIGVEEKPTTNKLRRTRSLMIAQRGKEGVLVYCPKGHLTQEEMELTEHLDTLHIAGLLPGKETAVGGTWKVANSAVQGMCDIEGLIEHDLTGKLIEIKDDVAHITFLGQVKGIHLGAEVKMLIDAKAEFDVKEKRLTRLEWKQSDQRNQGPVNPAMSTEVTYKLTRKAIEEPSELSDLALVPALAVAPETASLVSHVDPRGRFELSHGREWHLVGQDDKHVVFRLVDRGDFVAQATLTPMKKSSGDMMTLDGFADQMADAPGWKQEEQIDKTDKVNAGDGVKAYRVAASGELEGVKAVQYFYLLRTDAGHEMMVAFTMSPNQVRNLDARDLAILRAIVLPK